ncbi:MAG TPA: glycosyltransferase, partial [Anaerolineales bacterium]
MKLLYIVDARSPIALNWISHFIQGGHEVHIVSTFPCLPVEGAASLLVIPVAMSGNYGAPESVGAKSSLRRRLIPVTIRTKIRQMIAPWTFPGAARAIRRVIRDIQPDLIHAMRIPFEGMVASMAIRGMDEPVGRQDKAPLLISVWGNDFTLHAGSTPGMDTFTRESLQACDALHTDCLRDLRMARDLGFASSKPSIVLPGGGGVRLEVFFPADTGNPPKVEA